MIEKRDGKLATLHKLKLRLNKSLESGCGVIDNRDTRSPPFRGGGVIFSFPLQPREEGTGYCATGRRRRPMPPTSPKQLNRFLVKITIVRDKGDQGGVFVAFVEKRETIFLERSLVSIFRIVHQRLFISWINKRIRESMTMMELKLDIYPRRNEFPRFETLNERWKNVVRSKSSKAKWYVCIYMYMGVNGDKLSTVKHGIGCESDKKKKEIVPTVH